MNPEQLSFMIGSIYGSTLTLLLLRPSARSRNRRDPFLDCCERRGSNPPPPGIKPQPPSGPPQPLAAQLIRYWTWKDDQTRQALTEGPTTPKPQFPPGRVLGPDGSTIGNRPIPPSRKP